MGCLPTSAFLYCLWLDLISIHAIKEDLEGAGYTLLSAEKTKIASNYVTLDSEEEIKFMELLIEKLEDDDDVMNVYHNWENCD